MFQFDLQRFALDSYVVCYPVCPSDGSQGIGGVVDLRYNTWSHSALGQSTQQPLTDPGRYSFFFSGNREYGQMDQTISLGGQDFTIEGWAYMLSTSGKTSRIFELNTGTGYMKRILFGQYDTNKSNGLVDLYDGAGSHVIQGCITYDTWFHFAIVYQYSANKALTFIDGELKDTQTCSSFSKGSADYTLYLGKSTFSQDGLLAGYIAEFCISNGIARYNSNFTKPTTYKYPLYVGSVNEEMVLVYNSDYPTMCPLYNSPWIQNAKVIHGNTTRYVDLSTSSGSSDLRIPAGSIVRQLESGNRIRHGSTLTANHQDVNTASASFSVVCNGSTETMTFSATTSSVLSVRKSTKTVDAYNKQTQVFNITASGTGSIELTIKVPGNNVYLPTAKTIEITSYYIPLPVITASNLSYGSSETGTTTISATNMTSVSNLTYELISNEITATYGGTSETWNKFSMSQTSSSITNGTASKTLKFTTLFYGTATLRISATNDGGTVTKDITITSTYVPPFSSFSLSEQPNAATLTWHKIKRIISEGKAGSWTVGSRIGYNLTNRSEFSTAGWNIYSVYCMYLGCNHDGATNTADFAWTNHSSSNNGQLYPIANCGNWSWQDAVTGNDELGGKVGRFIEYIKNGSGNMSKVIQTTIRKNTFTGPSDTTDNYDTKQQFVNFDPGEIYASFDSMNSTTVYSGITFNGSFWTRRYYYYFNGGTSFVNDENASKPILLVFRI